MNTKISIALLSILALGTLGTLGFKDDGCGRSSQEPVSASGVTKASVVVKTQANGFTTEQNNVRDRLIEDNKPGSIKHLYVISPFSGQVLMYSTVKGKVSSGGKRLTPTSVDSYGSTEHYGGFSVDVGGTHQKTLEVLQDDGTYGSSSDYIYWWDTKGVYHMHMITGGQILHVSSEPISVKGVILNLSSADQNKDVEEVAPLVIESNKKK